MGRGRNWMMVVLAVLASAGARAGLMPGYVTMTIEHVDLNVGYTPAPAGWPDPGQWSLGPRNDDEFPAVQYEGDEALLYVGQAARTTRSGGNSFDFLGVGAGQTYWRLPQAQNIDLLYLGVAGYGVSTGAIESYNASSESGGRVTGTGRWVRMELVSVQGPGAFSVWQNTDTGPRVMMASADGVTLDDSLWVVAGGHNHYNYGFSAEGVYAVTLRPMAFVNDGNAATLGPLDASEELFTIYFGVEALPATYLPGDFDLSGGVDVQDINPFVLALGSLTAYEDYLITQKGVSAGDVSAVVAAVDPDGSGVINVQDINPFVAMLAGSGAEMAIPEPTGACVLLLAAGGVLIRRG